VRLKSCGLSELVRGQYINPKAWGVSVMMSSKRRYEGVRGVRVIPETTVVEGADATVAAAGNSPRGEHTRRSCWMRRLISSKCDTCTESMEVYAAGISVKVDTSYPGRSARLPQAAGVERRRDGRAEMHRASSGERGRNPASVGALCVRRHGNDDCGLRIRRSGNGARTREQHLDSRGCRHNGNAFVMRREPPCYGTARLWCGRTAAAIPASYPLIASL